MNRLLPLLVARAEGGPYNDYSYPPSEWPSLSRVAAQVPGFAGLTFGEAGNQFQLTDLTQAERLRVVLKADPRWQKYLLGAGAIKAQYNVTQLVKAAQAIKAARPQTRVRVDTFFNRVTLNLPSLQTAQLARRLGVADLVVSEQKPRLRARISPVTVSLEAMKSNPFGFGHLQITLTNTVNRPALFGYGCGGTVPVEILSLDGERVPGESLNCTAESRAMRFQPGQSHTFPSLSTTALMALKPGRYLWHIRETGQRIPFTLHP
jgi:hypothetical protein